MQIRTWPRTRSCSQWWMGRRSRSPVLMIRKSRSTRGKVVGGDGGGGVQFAGRDGGADDVNAVQGGLGADGGRSRRHARQPGLMSRMKCLATLYRSMTFPAGTPILSASFSRPAVTWSRAFPQELLGGGQQVLALAGPLGGQQRVAAGDQPLAQVVRAGDLGQVLLIEQGHLQRAAVIGELAEIGR